MKKWIFFIIAITQCTQSTRFFYFSCCFIFRIRTVEYFFTPDRLELMAAFSSTGAYDRVIYWLGWVRRENRATFATDVISFKTHNTSLPSVLSNFETSEN